MFLFHMHILHVWNITVSTDHMENTALSYTAWAISHIAYQSRQQKKGNKPSCSGVPLQLEIDIVYCWDQLLLNESERMNVKKITPLNNWLLDSLRFKSVPFPLILCGILLYAQLQWGIYMWLTTSCQYTKLLSSDNFL